jgi:hypothetical protein
VGTGQTMSCVPFAPCCRSLTLMYSDVATPTRKARPFGVQGCEVYVAVADNPPTNPKEYRFVAFCTRTPKLIKFKSDKSDKPPTSFWAGSTSKAKLAPGAKSSAPQSPRLEGHRPSRRWRVD